jgi:hypothetical protein
VRERGAQSRRGRSGPVIPARGPAPEPARSSSNVWQIVAIIALIAATAGWTTVAVIALREPSTAVVTPSDSFDPTATDDSSIPPAVAVHEIPELEALLPTDVGGTALETQSSNGDAILTDDAWSTALTGFLTRVGKTSPDLQFAQAYDPIGAVEATVWVYRVIGAEGPALRDALVQAWTGYSPNMTWTKVTLDGKEVMKGDVADETVAKSYLYVRDGLVYDIETTDEKFATDALAALPEPGTSASPGASAGASAPSVGATPRASVSPAP